MEEHNSAAQTHTWSAAEGKNANTVIRYARNVKQQQTFCCTVTYKPIAYFFLNENAPLEIEEFDQSVFMPTDHLG